MADPESLPNDSAADFSVTGGTHVYAESDASVKKLILKDGTFNFPGNKAINIYDGAWIQNATVDFQNRLVNQSSDVTYAFTNSVIHYKGQDGNNNVTPFTTGSGHDGVRVEMVNTTDHAQGMLWDCMEDGFKVGDWSSNCSLLVDGGGITAGAVVTNMHYNKRGFHVGAGNNASGNTVIIRRGAQIWDNITVNNAGNSIGNGTGANDNRVEILGGDGYVSMLNKGYVGAIGSGASFGNRMVVDGQGFAGSAVLDGNRSGVTIGNDGSVSNRLEILNGGCVSNLTVNVGVNSSSNVVLVSGVGSILYGRPDAGDAYLAIGSGDGTHPARGNCLIVENGGVVRNFGKWSTFIGDRPEHTNNGHSQDNGIEVRAGGQYKLANDLYIGRSKYSDGNYLHVTGVDALFDGSSKRIMLGGAYLDNLTEGESKSNEIVVDSEGLLKVDFVNLADDTKLPGPNAIHDNRILVTTGGKMQVSQKVEVGLASDASRTADESITRNNKVIVEQGGILQANNLYTYSGNGNAIVIRDGGVLQLTDEDPKVYPAEAGSISVENAVISYRRDYGCNPNRNVTWTEANRWTSLTFSGQNAFRLCKSNTSSSYSFGVSEDPRHFVRLEMVDGTTAWDGGSSQTLAIESNGAMLCSNTTASVNAKFIQNGPLSICNSTLTLMQDATLNAAITVAAETFGNDGLTSEKPALVLSSGTTIGSDAKIVVTGSVSENQVVYRGTADQVLAVEGLPSGWTLAYDDGVYKVQAGEPVPVRKIKVSFNGNGGSVSEKFRIVNTGEPYGSTVNLYTELSDIPGGKGNGLTVVSTGVYNYDTSDKWCNFWSKPTQWIDPGETYTYFVDVQRLVKTGESPVLDLGDTGDWNSQLPRTSFSVSDVGVYARAMVARESSEKFGLLGRDYITLNSGACQMKFCIALYAGTSVNVDNYAFAAPGQSISLPLPSASYEGHVFDGWEDAAGNLVTDETIVQVDGDNMMLTARWVDLSSTVPFVLDPKSLTEGRSYGFLPVADPEKTDVNWSDVELKPFDGTHPLTFYVTVPNAASGVSYYRIGSLVNGNESTKQVGDTVYGIMKLTPSAATALVSVPWLSLAAVDKDVSVDELVQTGTLSKNDMVLAYNGGASRYDGWQLEDGAWNPVSTVSGLGGVTVAAASADARLSRGTAVWIKRKSEEKPIYLTGRYKSAPVEVEVPASSYMLLGNALAEVVQINALDWSSATEGDVITIPDGPVPRVLKWDAANHQWFRNVSVIENGRVKQDKKVDDLLPMGQGFWYGRAGTESFTFTGAKKTAGGNN